MQDPKGLTPEDMAVLRPLFVSSGREYLATFLDALATVRTAEPTEETLGVLHRSIHSLKGAALQLGVLHIGTLGKAVEAVALAVRRKPGGLPAQGIDLLEEGARQLAEYLTHIENGEETTEPPGELLSQLQGLADVLADDDSQRKAMGG
ncbi:MAG: Hpt domain-containing protein [Candidatus Eisenbacteria sp.]|nr:Hpt domain-containing protein [Candidatus Eisenbacteria bacterium]